MQCPSLLANDGTGKCGSDPQLWYSHLRACRAVLPSCASLAPARTRGAAHAALSTPVPQRCGKKAQRSCHGRVRTEAPRESRELDHIDFSVGSTSRSSHSVACKALWSRHQLPAPEVSPTSVRVYNLRSGIREFDASNFTIAKCVDPQVRLLHPRKSWVGAAL